MSAQMTLPGNNGNELILDIQGLTMQFGGLRAVNNFSLSLKPTICKA